MTSNTSGTKDGQDVEGDLNHMVEMLDIPKPPRKKAHHLKPNMQSK